MEMKKIVGTASLIGALSFAALGLGAGTAPADPGPNIPGVPGQPHGPDGRVPPGQIKQACPWQSPPGQWVGGPHGIPCT